jgi:ribosomal protein S18 acetylase RimI-like enzyme
MDLPGIPAPDLQTPDIRAIERACLTAVPAERVAFDGAAIIRAGGGLGGSGRANSACWLDPADEEDLPARIARIEAWYARLGRAAKVRITPLAPVALERLLAQRGWVRADETVVMAAPLDGLPLPDGQTRMDEAPNEAWLLVREAASGASPGRMAEKRATPALLMVPGAWISVPEDGRVGAVAFAAVVGPLAMLGDVATLLPYRGRGLGRRACLAALGWARAEGARVGVLQVEADNDAALSLYRRLGFREVYRYAYRAPG